MGEGGHFNSHKMNIIPVPPEAKTEMCGIKLVHTNFSYIRQFNF